MLSVKKHSSIPKIEIGKEGDNKNEKKKKNRRKRKTAFSFFTHKKQETRAPIINKGILSKTNSNNDSVNRISKWKQPFSDVCQNMCS